MRFKILTFAFVFLLFLLAKFVQGQFVQVQIVKIASEYLCKRFHGKGPLGNQLFPAGERGQYRQQVVPQLTRDVHVQIPFDPGYDESLTGESMNKSRHI